MNSHFSPDFPPTDFVAFLAQRAGLSQEAAETRLNNWFGEYHASASKRPSASGTHSQAASLGL